MNIKFRELPVETYYHTVLCSDCNIELIKHPDKKIGYFTEPIMFPYICPECKSEILLTEDDKPQVKFKKEK